MLGKRTPQFLIALAVFLLFTFDRGIYPSAPKSFNTASGRRNVILICMDTVRYDSFGLPESVGYQDTFSKWAESAIRFTETQSTSSWTIPAVASMMTGLYPVQHGAGRFEQPVGNLDLYRPLALSKAVPTLAEILTPLGFETLALVASPWITENHTLHGFKTVHLIRDEEIQNEAQIFVSSISKSPKPFFLYLHFLSAHDEHWKPIDSLRKENATLSVGLSQGILRFAPARICDDENYETCVRYQGYVRSILKLRRNVASVLTLLQKTRLLKNTIVILISDHGEEFEDHIELESKLAIDTRQYYGLGHGHTMYQELLHVPLLIWHPLYTNRDINLPVSLVDIAPSILDWLSLNRRLGEFGQSLVDVQRLDHLNFRDRPLFSSGIAYGPDQTAVLWNRWKEIVIPKHASLVFNLSVDHEEKQPKAPVPANKLHSLIATYKVLPKSDAVKRIMTEEQLERLKSIGYLGEGIRWNESRAERQGNKHEKKR